MDPALEAKKRAFEAQKARTKLALNLCTICGKGNAKLCQGCGTTAYCSTACQRIDWRDRGHRKACKKIRDERAAEAARAEAPAPSPSPPPEVFYGPAPRSHADEVRARIAAEHEAARARREAEPEATSMTGRLGSRCPICMEDWDVNAQRVIRVCCCRFTCQLCDQKTQRMPCPLCRSQPAKSDAEELARLRRHVENEQPEAITYLAQSYVNGSHYLVKSGKKAAKLYKRAMELGNTDAMYHLGYLCSAGYGVKRDTKKAEKLWKKAADRGHAGAQLVFGLSIQNQAHATSGIIGEQYDEAFRYFSLAADKGHAAAMWKVGGCYEGGLAGGYGVEADLDEAKRWYARAAARGYEEAKKDLARLAQSDP